MDFKLMGSSLLIIGTCIGAGMLALPIATAQLGFAGAVLLMLVCWFVMTCGAFLLLEVTLWMPLNSNLNTMARRTIGPIGQCISWLAFLFLLYSLLSAYIAGSSDLFQHLLSLATGVDLPRWLSSILFIVIFGTVVWWGVRSIDYANRFLMIFKFTSFFLVVFMLIPFVSPAQLAEGDFHQLTSYTALMVSFTAFGFAAIVPSVRIYLQGNVDKVRKAILIGSLVPLLCYLAWDAVIMGVIPLDPLSIMLSSENSTSDLSAALSAATSNSIITFFMRLFTSVCVLTSFLGVSLSLTDFWADALQQEKKGWGNVAICGLTFIPPLLIVLFFPGVFVSALEYAGIDSVILLVLLPVWMAWTGRYHRHMANGFIVPGGKLLLVVLALFSLFLLTHPVWFHS